MNMKTFAAFAAGFATAMMVAAGAATLTVTTTGAEDARIAPAFGAKLGLGRNATAAEVKADVRAYIVGVVNNYEFVQADVTARAGVTLIDPQ